MHCLELVLVDGVAHARVDALVDSGIEAAKHCRGLAHSFDRDVCVYIAAAEKHGSAAKRSRVFAWRSGRPNQASAQPDDGGVAIGMPRGEFKRQTGPLREPEHTDA